MSIKPSDTELKLSNMSVTGFRGIEDLTISHLGRVTLFAGKNGVSKTTLLEAIRLYAARCNFKVLDDILNTREEYSSVVDEDGDEVLTTNCEALFHGRQTSTNTYFSIGPKDSAKRQLRVRVITLTEKIIRELDYWAQELVPSNQLHALEIEFGGKKFELPLLYAPSRRRQYSLFKDKSGWLPEVKCESLGPGLLDNSRIATLWDKIALTETEDKALQGLNLLFGNSAEAERIAVIGDDRSSRLSQRRIVVKLKGQNNPVPLKSLGDGATRLFGIALALANSKDGFLVLDEVENGIHYSAQRNFWNMVLRTAHDNRTQVFATTHSWDCVKGFALAASAVNEVEGTLIRLERDGNQTRVIEYSEDDLEVAAEQNIEVR